jgi:hypothetical protein
MAWYLRSEFRATGAKLGSQLPYFGFCTGFREPRKSVREFRAAP